MFKYFIQALGELLMLVLGKTHYLYALNLLAASFTASNPNRTLGTLAGVLVLVTSLGSSRLDILTSSPC
jgi:hypothetical protein